MPPKKRTLPRPPPKAAAPTRHRNERVKPVRRDAFVLRQEVAKEAAKRKPKPKAKQATAAESKAAARQAKLNIMGPANRDKYFRHIHSINMIPIHDDVEIAGRLVHDRGARGGQGIILLGVAHADRRHIGIMAADKKRGKAEIRLGMGY